MPCSDCKWKQIEGWLHSAGPFTGRPRELLNFINEPFASGIIYPAVMAAWTFIGLVFLKSQALVDSISRLLPGVRFVILI